VFNNNFYVHYPVRQSKIIAFGEQTKGKLGTNIKTGTTEKPFIIKESALLGEEMVEMGSAKDYTVVLRSNGELYKTGWKNSNNGGEWDIFKEYTPHKKAKIMECGKKSIWIVTEENEIWADG
jgi:alpha-tubulin suppressor-like RCC1 family protein